MKTLLIENSRFLRPAIERSLVKAGHEVTGMADGREALQAARGTDSAIILLDRMLPGLDGTCVLQTNYCRNRSPGHPLVCTKSKPRSLRWPVIRCRKTAKILTRRIVTAHPSKQEPLP